jgi:hypothetical protein
MKKLGTLPLTINAEETFSIVILETVYNMRQIWNTLGYWFLDILDENGDPIVMGIRLIGNHFMLAQYPSLIFDLKIDSPLDPTRDNLSQLSVEVWSK